MQVVLLLQPTQLIVKQSEALDDLIIWRVMLSARVMICFKGENRPDAENASPVK